MLLDGQPVGGFVNVNSMLRILRDLLGTPEAAELGPTIRPGTLPEAEIDQELNNDAQISKLPAEKQKLIRSLMLLWHDHLDSSHTLAQAINNPDGALIHGIMHRREPDFGNAEYWFRRAGGHPIYPELGKRARNFLDQQKETKLLERLTPDGRWDPMEFIQACAEAANKGKSGTDVLREIQRIETQVLLEYFSGEQSADCKGLA